MTDDETPTTVDDAPAVTTPSDSPDAESVLNVVAYIMGTLALVLSVAVVFWMWSNGDLVWPFGTADTSIPACIPGLDHC